jgi:riboflavin kinase
MSKRRGAPTEKSLVTLLELARMGAVYSYAEVSSGKLGEVLGLTQQAASRRLIDLESAGLVSRVHSGHSLKVRLTAAGLGAVRSFYGELTDVFENTRGKLTFKGRVFSGIGKGRYYVGHPEYQKRFAAALRYKPYPGTLNVKLEEERFIEQLKSLRSMGGIRVEGFTQGKEGFSSITCFDGDLSGVRVTLLFIDITHYNESVVELISPVYLRGKLGLKDGDLVTFTIDVASLAPPRNQMKGPAP